MGSSLCKLSLIQVENQKIREIKLFIWTYVFIGWQNLLLFLLHMINLPPCLPYLMLRCLASSSIREYIDGMGGVKILIFLISLYYKKTTHHFHVHCAWKSSTMFLSIWTSKKFFDIIAMQMVQNIAFKFTAKHVQYKICTHTQYCKEFVKIITNYL